MFLLAEFERESVQALSVVSKVADLVDVIRNGLRGSDGKKSRRCGRCERRNCESTGKADETTARASKDIFKARLA